VYGFDTEMDLEEIELASVGWIYLACGSDQWGQGV